MISDICVDNRKIWHFNIPRWINSIQRPKWYSKWFLHFLVYNLKPYSEESNMKFCHAFFSIFSTFLNFKVFLCPVNGCYVTRIFEFVGHNNDISIFNWFQAFKSKLLHLWSLCFAICIIISQEQCCYIAPKTMLTVNYFKTFKDFKGFKWPIVNTKLRFQSTFFYKK